MTQPSYHDVLTLAHRGESMSKDAIVSYYLTSYDECGALVHLKGALEKADEITEAAARIRKALATPEPALVEADALGEEF